MYRFREEKSRLTILECKTLRVFSTGRIKKKNRNKRKYQSDNWDCNHWNLIYKSDSKHSQQHTIKMHTMTEDVWKKTRVIRENECAKWRPRSNKPHFSIARWLVVHSIRFESSDFVNKMNYLICSGTDVRLWLSFARIIRQCIPNCTRFRFSKNFNL